MTLNVGLFSNFKVDESKSQGDITYQHRKSLYAVASLGGAPRVTPEGKQFLWLNLQRTVDKRGRTGKKGAGIRPLGGDTWLKDNKNDSDE